MPRIFDNIEERLLPALKSLAELSYRGDFCVGYFNLRGWRQLDEQVEQWAGAADTCCRLLIGMQRLPDDEIEEAYRLLNSDTPLDNQRALRLKRTVAQKFRDQLTVGAPTDVDEAGLRRLARQIKAGKVVVKLHLRHTLHAKLYLLFRNDPVTPTVGFVGSSNLTMAGLSHQGELNVDVTDQDACLKLAHWFNDRWDDRWCLDISQEIVEIIEQSWAREELIPPHHIYIKMAYHLSEEAREGIREHHLPRDLRDKLFEFQEKAVKIAAHHVQKRGGVLLGDVVGLGKTLMATALARVLSDDLFLETLILCPLNLVPMWEDYCHEYRLPSARVMSYSRVLSKLEGLRRYRLVILDESHNLRSREGKIYRAIVDYITRNACKCILLSATPYNKSYEDIASQLRLFVPPDLDLGISPQRLMQERGATGFAALQVAPQTLAAFEKSSHPDDWRELMRLYLVRRTRSFIKRHYAEFDSERNRHYLTFPNGNRSYFPDRIPKTVNFPVSEDDPSDQYARLYSAPVVDLINQLALPRYGLGNFVATRPIPPASAAEQLILNNLSLAGTRLMGFCRTNLFKRLESSGYAFLLSVERHILRNFVFLYALEQGLSLPIGTQGAELLDTQFNDEDEEIAAVADGESSTPVTGASSLRTEDQFRARAAAVYNVYATEFAKRFKWLSPTLFTDTLAPALLADSKALMQIFDICAAWDPLRDAKLQALLELTLKTHPTQKLLIFTQFADTVDFLTQQLRRAGAKDAEGAKGGSGNLTDLVYRFSPRSNNKPSPGAEELRILVATDVLSEGQNLQDCAIIVNYDLPWAIIRLIQRAGRVDRIGQQSSEVLCYSFLPADGLETIIALRSKVRRRLDENAEVIGTDETFFEGDHNGAVIDLYHEKAGLLDDEDDSEVDLSSQAYEIWKDAITADPSLSKTIPAMQPVSLSTRQRSPQEADPGSGVLVYLKTATGANSLAWVDPSGQRVTESQYRILKAAECAPGTPALPRQPNHHQLVADAVVTLAAEEAHIGGSLGRPSGARYRTYERLQRHAAATRGTLFNTQALQSTINEIYKYPLRESAVDALNRELRANGSDDALAKLATELRDEGKLSQVQGDDQTGADAKIICSMGLIQG
jgi:superfamily II DNA or RNA helicase